MNYKVFISLFLIFVFVNASVFKRESDVSDEETEYDEDMVEIIRQNKFFNYSTWIYPGKPTNSTQIAEKGELLFGNFPNFTCYKNQMPSADCQIKCTKDPRKCKGDRNYCQTHGCERQMCECHCKSSKLVMSYKGVINEELVPAKLSNALSFIPSNVPKVRIESGRVLMSTENKRVVANPSTAVVNLDVQVLDIVITPPKLVTVHLTKSSWKESFELTSHISLKLPDKIFYSTDYLVVTILQEGEIIKYESIYILGERICRIKDCLICMDAASNFKCLPRSQQFVFVIMMMIIAVMLLAFMPVTFYLLFGAWTLIFTPIRIIYYILKGIFKSKMIRDLISVAKKTKVAKDYIYQADETPKKKLTRTNEIARPDRDVESPPPEQNNDDNMSASERRLKERQRMMYGGSLYNASGISSSLLVICCVCVLGASACTSGIFAPATFASCKRLNENQEICDIFSQLTFSLQNIGAETCFSLTNGTEIVSSIKIRFVSERVDLFLSTDYASACWDGKFESEFSCAERSSCPEKCDPTYPTKIVRDRPDKLVDPDVINYPGYTICSRDREGCSWNGCDSCASPCVFSSFGLKPKNEFLLTSISNQIRSPTLEVESCGQMGDCNKILVKIVGLDTETFYGKVKIIGTLQGPIIDFGTKKIAVRDNNNIFLVDASPSGGPVAGAIGDIQADTTSKLMSASPDAFIFAKDVYTVQHRQNSDYYEFRANGCLQMNSGNKLPVVYAGNTWANTPQGIIGSDLLSSAALLGTFEVNGQLKYIRNVNKVCPRANLLNASGCFNCSMGSTLRISARSVCMPGLAIVSSNATYISIQTTSIALTNTFQDFIINFQTIKAVNSFPLTIQSDGEIYDITAEFTAIEYTDVIIPNDTYIPGNGTVKKDKDGGFSMGDLFSKDFFGSIRDFFEDIAKGNASWWMIIILVVAIVIALIVVAIVVVPIAWQASPGIAALANNSFPAISKYIGSKFKMKKQ